MIIVNTGDLFPGHGTVSRFSGARMWVRNARTRGAFYKSPIVRAESGQLRPSLPPLSPLVLFGGERIIIL